MAKGAWWKEVIGALVPAAGTAASSFKTVARETMVEAQERVRETTKMVAKAAVVFLIIAIGMIYVLNGFGKYLETAQNWMPGMGAMVVGGVLVVLGLFALLIRK
ncbi:hypothetical protein GOV07_03975 [Candidatus Woesearchaeota archaeon]|nr:hypothetical protein [Candidatus Woesearchaeota archaeon]